MYTVSNNNKKTELTIRQQLKKYGYKSFNETQGETKIWGQLKELFVFNEELPIIDIYISKEKDELYIILDGNGEYVKKHSNDLDRIISGRITLLQWRNEEIYKVKYNIVQLILYCEFSSLVTAKDIYNKLGNNLSITRKIFIKCSDANYNTNTLLIDKEVTKKELIKLPFYVIERNAKTNESIQQQIKNLIDTLEELVPQVDDTNNQVFFERNNYINNRKQSDGKCKKNLSESQFKRLKGLIEQHEN